MLNSIGFMLGVVVYGALISLAGWAAVSAAINHNVVPATVIGITYIAMIIAPLAIICWRAC